MAEQWLESLDEDGSTKRRRLRIGTPLLVTVDGESFAASDFTLNLDMQALFVSSDAPLPFGARGKVSFRPSRFDESLEIEVQVVQVVTGDQASDRQPEGIGMQIVETTQEVLEDLSSMIDGLQNGSAVASIRRKVAETGITLDNELRLRPTDQKIMLALQANNREVEALIRETNPSVMLRLLDNPRLSPAHVISMLRKPNTTTRVLSAIYAKPALMKSAEARYLFTIHPQANPAESLQQLRALPLDKLTLVSTNRQIKVRLRTAAEELLRSQGGPGKRS